MSRTPAARRAAAKPAEISDQDLFPAEAPAVEARDQIGGNNPPSPIGLPTADEIRSTPNEDALGLVKEATDLAGMFSRMPAKIEDAAVYDRATTLGTRIQAFNKKLDKARKAAKDPYLRGGEAVDEVFSLQQGEGEERRALADVLKKAHGAVKGRLSDYDTEQHRIQTAQREAEAEMIAAAAAQDGIVIDPNAVVAGAGGPASTRSQHGGMSVKAIVRDYEIVDPTLVPASMCSPDPAKIKAAIEAGAKEIPGILITERVSTHVKG